MSTNWDRRKFIKTGSGSLIAVATGMSSFGFLPAAAGEIPVDIAAEDSLLLKDFKNPPNEARPWVFWYWIVASVSKEGITADLEAMKGAGIGGAYLMSIS